MGARTRLPVSWSGLAQKQDHSMGMTDPEERATDVRH